MNTWDLIALALLISLAVTTIFLTFFRRRVGSSKNSAGRRVKDEMLGQWKEKISSVLRDLGDMGGPREFAAMGQGEFVQLSQQTFTEVENVGQWLSEHKWLLSSQDQSRIALHLSKARRIDVALKDGLEALNGGLKGSLLPNIETTNRVGVELLLESSRAELADVKAILSARLTAFSKAG